MAKIVPSDLSRLALSGAHEPEIQTLAHLRDALRHSHRFADVSTFEILLREWAADGRSVRPSHQMVGHTGFITVARRTSPLGEDDS